MWRNGIYTGIELETPFESDVVDKLNCIQSGDVMFICSGKYPVKTLSRYSDTDWRFDTYKLSEQPYGEVNIDKESTVILNGDTLTATKDIFNADMVHSVMQIEHYVKAIITSETGKVIKGSYDGDDERILMAENEYNNINYNVEQFSSDEDLSWKFTSHGTWNGTVKIQISNDNGTTWKDYRVYTYYSNFGVEKVGGTITDDSAITLPVINRKMYDIRHLIPANDLLILTSGNEWIIDGSKTITPTNCNLRTQTQRGASECEPQYIGNRCVYVQARGCVVRDLGYSYESDNYTGADLTLFVKHLTKYRNFITSAYAQDPDSIVYYVTDDGNIDCLTYIPEQKVYAWSHFTTKGKYKYAESVAEGEQDSLYVIVERDFKSGTVMCIERFENSFGGKIGRNFNHMDDISLPPLKLYSGDKACILPKFDGVYSTDVSVCIFHEKPYPFNLLSVTREIEIGGGFPNVTGL